MIERFEAVFTPHRRRVLYRFGWVATLLGVGHGVISQGDADLYLLALAALLGMADRNVVYPASPHWSASVADVPEGEAK